MLGGTAAQPWNKLCRTQALLASKASVRSCICPATRQAMYAQSAKWDSPARDAYKGIKVCLVALMSSKVPCTVAISYNYMVKGTFDGGKLPWVLPADIKKLENLGKDAVKALERVLARHDLALPKAAAPTVVLAGSLVVRASARPCRVSASGADRLIAHHFAMQAPTLP